jgi:DUF3108-like
MRLFKIALIFILTIHLGYSQTNCKPYVPTIKGATWEITNYTAKDKTTGKIAYELIDKVENGNDITFKIKTTTFDKKGAEVYSNIFEAKCINGKFDFDMAFKMDGNALQAYENMDVQIDASKFEIPSFDTSAGTKLDDGSLEIKVGSGGMSMFKMTILITDRNVEAKDDITTPAGTFNCIVLSQKVSTKMMIRVQGASKEWYAENIGLVRSESYNKKGKLMGYSLLTKLEK